MLFNLLDYNEYDSALKVFITYRVTFTKFYQI